MVTPATAPPTVSRRCDADRVSFDVSQPLSGLPYNYRATTSTLPSRYYSSITMTTAAGNGAGRRGATTRLR
jgi:hypothetical protein